MLDDTRNLIGDIASGKIKDQRLALLADELKITTRKLSDANIKLDELKRENNELRSVLQQHESTINHFRLKLENDLSGCKLLEEQSFLLLEALFDSDMEATLERITSGIGLSGNVAKHYFDSLISERLVRQVGQEPQPYRLGETQRYLPTYEITASGRKQVMLRRNSG